MSHLGDRLSALVDGELGGAERDRAHAHLAACEQCRTEAAELRALKRKLRGLMDGAPSEAAMTSRLIAMTGPGGPMPPRRRLLRVVPGRRPASGPVASRPGSRPPWPSPRRRRYLVLGTVSLVVAAALAVAVPGLLVSACSSQSSAGPAGGDAVSAAGRAATAGKAPAAVRRPATVRAVRLLTQAAQAAIVTSYQGQEILTRW